MKKHIKNRLKKILMLSGIFLAALVVYFVMSYQSMERQNTVYSSMDEARFPVLFAEAGGRKVNPMHGYVQELQGKAARDSLTVLPEDRRLRLYIEESGSMAASAQYEIRSLDMSQLIEKGSVGEISRSGEETSIVLPIQNLIEKDREYLLRVILDTGELSLNYYTRICWAEKPQLSEEMLQLASEFTRKTFSRTEARALAVYLETDDTADNSVLSHVTIRSGFQQLTWGDSGMQPEGEFFLSLKELSGVMGEVQISYRSVCTDSNGNVRRFMNEDNFVFRYDPQRIFIMNYDRKTEEIFDTAGFRFSGKQLLLGVQDPEKLQTLQSESGQYTAFKTAEGLFRYDSSEKGACTAVFSYLTASDYLRSAYRAHDMKILSVKNNGDVDFVVYGYINRGKHEGYNGVLYYTYDSSRDTVVENFFLPLSKGYEALREDVERLCYVNPNGMFFLYYDGNVYEVDTNSLEVISMAAGLSAAEFAASDSGRYIAYQESTAVDPFHSDRISFADLEKESSTELTETGRHLRVFGFIGEDLAYGVTDPELGDVYTLQHEVAVSEIRIIDAAQNEKTRYTREGLYFANAGTSGSRIHFEEFRYDGEGFVYAGSDSIICNKEQEERQIPGVESRQDALLLKNWYIRIPDIGSRVVQSHAPRSLSVERTSSIDLNIPERRSKEPVFYAYSLGHFRGESRTLQGAVSLVYDEFGYVLDENNAVLWNRTDKETVVSLRNPLVRAETLLTALPELKNREHREGMILLNACGIDLNSVLYYVGKGIPVAAYTDSGWQLISGYNQFNILLLSPDSGEQTVMGKQDADEYFRARGNRFAAALFAV